MESKLYVPLVCADVCEALEPIRPLPRREREREPRTRSQEGISDISKKG